MPAGLLAGVVLTGGAMLQQAGLVSTTAGKGGFVTGLYVVLVPLAGLFWGQRAGWPRWVGVVLAACGLYLLSVTSRFTIERGDLLVLGGAFFWTGHVLLLSWLSPRTDAVALACVQNAVCAALSGAVLPFVERPSLEAIRAAAVPILYGGLLSVGVAFTLQVLGQRRAPPAHAALLLSTEAVFAALGGWWLLGERLGTRGLAGCALMFAGMLCAQLPLLLRLKSPRGEVKVGMKKAASQQTAPQNRSAVVVTGSTRGLGFALAEELLKRGCRVTVSGRGPESVRQAVERLGAYGQRVHGLACDVTDPVQVQDLWDSAARRCGRVDIWINNAGIAQEYVPAWELEPEAMARLIATNLLGTMYGSRTALRGNARPGGRGDLQPGGVGVRRRPARRPHGLRNQQERRPLLHPRSGRRGHRHPGAGGHPEPGNDGHRFPHRPHEVHA